MDTVNEIRQGLCSLGIEFGSTRIKAILIGADKSPVASGFHDWENRNEDGIWTYSVGDIMEGLADCYATLRKDVQERYGITLTRLKALGISAMMHGYMAFDVDGSLLTPFRTWRNTITEDESRELTELFGYPVPQRWTVSHYLKEIKDGAAYLPRLDHISTLAAYVHKLLTGEKVIGIGDASGMFPIDTGRNAYDAEDLALFDSRYHGPKPLAELLPRILLAGEEAGRLTEEGARLLDPSGDLEAGCPLCPPEGDAGTGMVATNAVLPRTGNVSAGTSAFAMVVLEHPLSRPYSELDLVTTPDGKLVAMAHTNNCTGSYDAWFSIFREVLEAMGAEVKKGVFYDTLLRLALKAEPDCGGLLSYNYISGEPITGLNDGCPMTLRSADSHFNLANFIRCELYTAVAAMRVGLDILFDKEDVALDVMNGHGGYFKTADVGQAMMAAALKTPIRVLSTAGEGGAWGIAILADYLSSPKPLPQYLEEDVFASAESVTVKPADSDLRGFDAFFRAYRRGLEIEKAAVKNYKED